LTELEIPGDFPPEVLAEAEEAARRPLPSDAVDLRGVEFKTLDPASARDLDQAYAIEETSDGFVVRYAIADVAHFVDPGSAIDAEAHRRGVTFYLPDGKAPLHPPVLSEGAASLLPDVDRPAVVYTVELGGSARVERAIVRSREKLAYDTAVDPLLQRVGERLEAEEAERGGVSLDLPSQEVEAVGSRFVLRNRTVLPIEGWNEQLSLLAGCIAAARLMIEGGVGILRTMPPPEEGVVAHLRRLAEALGVSWKGGYAETVRGVDRASVKGVVFLRHAVRALRGAGYVAFVDGPVPDLREHSAVAAPYAHVTAPLRRLADRHANEVVLALCAGTPVPPWARDALPALPTVMNDANRKSSAVERAVIDEVEALLLATCIGAELDAVVVSVEDDATVAIDDPVVVARMPAGGGWKPGDVVRVRVAGADPAARRVDLVPA
jgi:exoribonuclease R